MENEKRRLSAWKIVLIVICAIVFVVSAAFIVKHYVDIYNNQKMYTNLSGLVVEPANSNEEVPDYSALIKINPDFVGWIKVPNTEINYPVVKCDNNSFYLDHNFYKESDYRGAAYMDFRNDSKYLDSNTIIYAHNAYDTTMFSQLVQYEDIEFYKKSPVIEFNTVNRVYKWKVFAVFITNASPSEDNGYVFNYIYPYMGGDNFDGYITEINKRRLYDTGVDVNKNDKILTLSTCARNLDLKKYGVTTYRANTRIVVLARAVRAGESIAVDVNKASVNPNPKYPQLYYDKNEIANPYINDEKWYPQEVSLF